MPVESQPKKFEYYTPTPDQRRNGIYDPIPEYLTQSEHFQRLVRKCLKPFETDTSKRIRTFIDGGDASSPMDPNLKGAFTTEAERVVSMYCQSPIESDGRINQWFYNLEEVAPNLIAIMVRHDHYIGLVQQSNALNILAAALDIAQNPNKEITIRVGIGGSDDEFTPARFASYGLPALIIAEEIQTLFEQRKKNKLASFAANAEVRRTEKQTGEILQPKKTITVNGISGYTYTVEGLGTFKNIYLQSPNKACTVEITDATIDPTNQGYQKTVDKILTTFKFVD